MSEQNHSNPQNEQNRIYEIIHQITKKSEDGDYIFRGEPECYEKVSSTLYRQLEVVGVEPPGDMEENFQSLELEEASKFTEKTDEFEILTELQHFGGKTNLIDFTTDPYIALFFACYGPDSIEEDGRVILQDKNGAAKDWIREPRNPGPDSRVSAQKSIFVRPPKGVVDLDKKVVIPKDLKLPILTFLARQEPPISPESVYHDLHGFIRSQETRWNAVAESARGLNHVKKGSEANDSEEKSLHYKKAMEHFNRVLRLQPDSAVAYNNRGLAYVGKGAFDDAIADFTKAIELNSDLAVAYSNRGGAYREKGEFDTAIKDFNKAIELEPNRADTFSNRGGAYRNKGAFDDAIADFTKAIELDPNFTVAYYGLGLAYDDKGEIEKAIGNFDKAIELKPDYAEAYSDRGGAYARKGDFEIAIANYNKAIEFKPDYAVAYNNRGIAYVGKDEVGTAIKDFTKAIELKPDYFEAYNGRGIAYGLKGDLDTAINDFDKAIALHPNYVLAYNNRGLAYEKKGESDRAIKNYSRAIELNPDYVDAYYSLGCFYLSREEFERAIANFGKVLELDPSNALARQYRERAFQRLQGQTQR